MRRLPLAASIRSCITNRTLFSLFKYQKRLVFTPIYFRLTLFALTIAVLLSRLSKTQLSVTFYSVFETLLPVLTVPLFVSLFMREKRQRTLPIVGVSITPSSLIFYVRVVLMLLWMQLIILILSLAFIIAQEPVHNLPVVMNSSATRDEQIWPSSYYGGSDGLLAISITLLAPILFLNGISVFVAHLSTDDRTGYLVGLSFWMLNRVASNMASEPFFRYFYLFSRSSNITDLKVLGADWLTPKILQLIIGLILLYVSGRLLGRIDRYLH